MTFFLTVEILGNPTLNRNVILAGQVFQISLFCLSLSLYLSLSLSVSVCLCLSVSLSLCLSLSASEKNPFFKKNSCSGKIIPASEQLIFWQVKPFFLHFSKIPTSDSVFFVQWKSIFQQIFHLGKWKHFLASGNHFFLFTGFSSQWKPSLRLW